MTKRYYYLDNIKVLLIVLVIFHHAGQAYGDGGAWAYAPSNPEEYADWLWRFFSVNASFLMGLFFLISGFFIPGSFDRQGFWKFLGKKFMRLGIPLVLMTAFLTWFNNGKLEFGPMWFLEQLLFYCIVYAVIMVIFRAIAPRRNGGLIPSPSEEKALKSISFVPSMIFLFLFAGVMIGISYLCRRSFPQNSWTMIFGFLVAEPAHLAQYIMMLVAGMAAYRRGWLERMPTGAGIASLAIAMVISFIIWFAPKESAPVSFITQNMYIWDSAICVFMSTGLLWMFRDYGNKTNKFLKWCSAQAYGAYIFHGVLMIIFQFMVDKLWLGGVTGKFLFVGASICIISFGLTWLLKLIPGVKKVL